MDYRINSDAWKSVFAVPGVIVDENIKLSGAAQLKVILWVLRHWGENFEVEDISKALGMQSADVKDCMQYWCELGVMQAGEAEKKTEKEPVRENEEKKNKVVILRPEKPDVKYTAQRIASDGNIGYLMNFAESIFGRIISPNDKSTLLFINEYYGIPVEVIVMMLEYAASIDKCNTKYIEQLAANWWSKGIITLERADEYIKYLTESGSAAKRLLVILGQSHRPPTDDEVRLANLWFNDWRMSDEMIKEAYDKCVNNTGKFSYGYMKKIITGWHEKGITTPEQVKKEQNDYRQSKSRAVEGYAAGYDIAAYESVSAADSEELD